MAIPETFEDTELGRLCAAHGHYQWCVKVGKSLSKNGEIHCLAQQAVVSVSGALLLLDHEGRPNLALAPGQWLARYPVGFDGAPPAVLRWSGEVEPWRPSHLRGGDD